MKIASAFGTEKDFEENKTNYKFEYYPEDAIEFAVNNYAWAKKVEAHLTYIVLNQSSRSYSGLSPQKRQYLSLLVYEHFHLEMAHFG